MVKDIAETLGLDRVCTDMEGRFESEDDGDVDSAELEKAEHGRKSCDEGCAHVCWTVPEMKTQESQARGVADRQGFAVTSRDGSCQDQARIPEKTSVGQVRREVDASGQTA